MGRKSKELTEDRKQLVVDLKREGNRNCEIVKLLHLQFVQFGRSTTAQVMLKHPQSWTTKGSDTTR